jgi:hypothetical protein
MANPTTVSVRVKDNDDEYSTFEFNLGSSINTLASIEAASQQIIEDAQALMTGDVVAVQVTVPLDLTGWTLAPASGAAKDRLVGGRFIHTSLATPNAKKELNLPTFQVDTFVASGNLIDTSNAAVAALLASILGTTYTSNQDVELNTLVTAYETYGGKKR